MKAFAGSQALGSFGTSARNSGRVVANANNLNGPRFASNDAGVTWQPLASATTFNQLVDSYVFFPDSDAKIFAIGELAPSDYWLFAWGIREHPGRRSELAGSHSSIANPEHPCADR
jgi:hypothetical protein